MRYKQLKIDDTIRRNKLRRQLEAYTDLLPI